MVNRVFKMRMIALGLLVTVGLVFNACKGKECDDYRNPDCPNYDAERVRIENLNKEIAQLEKDSSNAMGEFRASIGPAKSGIEPQFDPAFLYHYDLADKGSPQADSVYAASETDKTLRELYGDQLPVDEEPMTNMKNKTISWKQVVALLADKRNQFKK